MELINPFTPRHWLTPRPQCSCSMDSLSDQYTTPQTQPSMSTKSFSSRLLQLLENVSPLHLPTTSRVQKEQSAQEHLTEFLTKHYHLSHTNGYNDVSWYLYHHRIAIRGIHDTRTGTKLESSGNSVSFVASTSKSTCPLEGPSGMESNTPTQTEIQPVASQLSSHQLPVDRDERSSVWAITVWANHHNTRLQSLLQWIRRHSEESPVSPTVQQENSSPLACSSPMEEETYEELLRSLDDASVKRLALTSQKLLSKRVCDRKRKQLSRLRLGKRTPLLPKKLECEDIDAISTRQEEHTSESSFEDGQRWSPPSLIIQNFPALQWTTRRD